MKAFWYRVDKNAVCAEHRSERGVLPLLRSSIVTPAVGFVALGGSVFIRL